MIYLDNAATTSICKAALDAVNETLRRTYANPSSLYKPGLMAKQVLEQSRTVIARAMRCAASDIYFTSGGTESNNIAVLGAARARKLWGNEIVVSGYEHPSVQNTVWALENEGFKVYVVKPAADGRVSDKDILRLVGKNTVLVTCMHVNNETGAMLDIEYLAREVKEINRRTAFHCDDVQGFLKHPFAITGAIDTVAISGHKIHAPKGIGALYVRKGFSMEPVLFGGGQEKGVRSGTENVAYAAGFARAVTGAADLYPKLLAVGKLAQYLEQQLCKLEGVVINSPSDASPYIRNFSLIGFQSETLLHFLEARDIYVSSGSACSGGEKSHTLVAAGLSEARVNGAVRVSFCAENTMQDIDTLVAALREAQNSLVRA